MCIRHCVCLCGVVAVATGRAEPQQPGQQSGRTALPGEQEGVREEGYGHCGAELGGCLRGSAPPTLPSSTPSPLLPPLLSIARSFLPHRDDDDDKKRNGATLSEELKCHPEKRKNETTKPQWTYKTNMLANTLKENRRGGFNLVCVSFFLMHDVK